MKSYGSQDMFSDLTKVLINPPLQKMGSVDYKKWHYDGPLNQNKIDENFSSFLNILKNFGTEIISLDQKETFFDSVFPHDASLVIDDGAIILSMGKKLRKAEPSLHKDLYKSIGVPIVGTIESPGTVEGGDCLWIDKKTLVVGRGFRTNAYGIKQISKILKRHGVEVISFDLPYFQGPDACLHLMSLISILDRDLAIIYTPLFPVELLKLLSDRGIRCIEIPEHDFQSSNGLCVNVLALSPRKLVMIEGFSATEKLLLESGCDIQTFDGNELCIKAEGGPTCLTRPIYRK